MPEQALYLKWRPLSFDDVVGQEHVMRTLRNSLKTGRIRHAYLFSGPRGTGKTTSARLLAKAVNCTHPDPDQRPCNECRLCISMNEGRFLDLIEIDAASHTGVDDVRDLRDKIAFTPGEGQYKVYIIDEVHRFSGNAFDALLKTLEEPPDHAIFVLATTEIDKVPATIKSRCLQFEFRRLSMHEVTERLERIAHDEGLNIERAALEMIAREGTGSVRDSISLLDQIVADPQEVITLELAQRILGTASARAVREMVEALLQRDAARGLHIINAAIDSGSDPRQMCQQIVEHLRALLLAQTASADLIEASADDRQLFERQAQAISRSGLLRALRAFNDAANSSGGGWQPQLVLELALLESLQEPEPVAASSVPAYAQPVAAAQSIPAAPAAPPIPAASGPEEAAVPSAIVREKLVELQRLIYRVDPNLPAMLDHVQVGQSDGNKVVFLTNRAFFNLLSQEKRKTVIERALSELFRKRLVLHLVSVEGPSGDAYPATPSPDVLNDPLIETGLELGGQIQDED